MGVVVFDPHQRLFLLWKFILPSFGRLLVGISSFMPVRGLLCTRIALSFFIATGLFVSSAYGQATLPANYAWDPDTSLPFGWTSVGMGTPYSATGSSGIAPNAGRFDDTGDRLIIHFNDRPGVLTYSLKGQPASGGAVSGTFSIMESFDGVDYSPLRVIVNKDSSWETYTNQPSASSRYIMFIYASKTNGNVAIDDVQLDADEFGANENQTNNVVFSVMSANLSIQTSPGYSYYEETAGRIFLGLKPDIVAIQEFNVTNSGGHRAYVDAYFGTSYYFFVESVVGNPNPIPNGIISRWPIIQAGEWADTNINNRDFAWATIDIPGPRDLHVVSIHLKANAGVTDIERRVAQSEALMAFIQASFPPDDFIVLAGDLNCETRGEPALMYLTNYFSDSRQPEDMFGDRDTNRSRSKPFDYVLANPALASQQVATVIGGLSFIDGFVFDETQWIPPPFPVESGDSYPTGRQHMAVVKSFSIFPSPPPPPDDVLAYYDFETDDGVFHVVPHRTHPMASGSTYVSDDGTYTSIGGHSGRAISDNGWNTGLRHYTFTVNIAPGYEAAITGMQFWSRSSGTGPIFWHVNHSLDQYAADLAIGEQSNDSVWSRNSFALNLSAVTGSVTFRLYGLSASGGAGTWAHDTVKLFGLITPSSAPSSPDSNGNGIPDEWELQYFGSLGVSTNGADFDGDGVTDLHEYLAGTSPTDPLSYLGLIAMEQESIDGMMRLSWSSSAGRYYLVRRSSAPGGHFELVASGLAASPPVNEWMDTPPPEESAVFYLIELDSQ